MLILSITFLGQVFLAKLFDNRYARSAFVGVGDGALIK
jgi:hypothetical protein